MNNEELQQLLIDTQKEYAKSNRTKDKIITLLIVLMFLEACVCYSGFVWYESQFDTDTKTETEYQIQTEGENANIDYNNVEGNQYNDSAIHNENK